MKHKKKFSKCFVYLFYISSIFFYLFSILNRTFQREQEELLDKKTKNLHSELERLLR